MDRNAKGFRLARRDLGLVFVAGAAAAMLPTSAAGKWHRSRTVRLVTIPAVQSGGLLDELVATFEAETKYTVDVSVDTDPYGRARAGAADIVFSHFGFIDLERFVQDGFGRWPRMIFSNIVIFVIPPSDPAGIRDLTDPVEAFRRIAETQSPFILNDLGEIVYVVDTLWNAAGRPAKGTWFVDEGLQGPAAMRAAADRGGYSAWGLHPFLMLQQQQNLPLEAMLFDDSLFQRIIASVVVDPAKIRSVNIHGALAFERFLIAPETQAQIRAFRHPDFDRPIFWPAANNNDN